MSQCSEDEAVAQGAEAQPSVTVEAINEVSAVREETQENTVRVPQALYKRLVQTYVLTTPLDLPTDEDGSVTLPIEATPLYLNGYTFGRYMIALKLLVKQRQNQDLNFDISRLTLLKEETDHPLQSWLIIRRELDKTGITIEQDAIKKLEEGETEAINRLFTRIERYMRILCGAEFLNFEDSENVFENLDLFRQAELNDQTSLVESLTKSVDLQSISDNQKLMFKGVNSPLLGKSQPAQGLQIATTVVMDALASNSETPIVSSPAKIDEFLQEEQLHQQQRPTKLKGTMVQQVTEGVDIVTLQTDRPLGQAQNSLEFLLVTLSRSFELTPRQAAALLTNNNQYLVTACVKGIKGGFFQPLNSWYKEIMDNIGVMAELLFAELDMFKDEASIQKVLATLASGLYSTNSHVVEQTFAVMCELLSYFDDDKSLQEVALSWFLSAEEGGLKRAVHAVKHQACDCTAHFVQLSNHFCKVPQQLELMYREELHNHCRTTGEYIVLILEVLGVLAKVRQQDVEQSGLIDYWLSLTAREAENDGIHTVEDRTQAIALMGEIWIHFTDFVSEDDDRANTIVFMLKRACREPSRLVKTNTAALMFKLLDIFSVKRNQSAPFIFKTLVFNLVEAPQDLTLRELYFTNFRELFMTQPKIPIALLVEPLFKQVKSQIGITYHLKTVDLDFFSFLADHPKLHVELSVQLLEILQKICLHDTVHFCSASPIFFRLVSLNIDDERMQEAVRCFVDSALVLMYEIELQTQKEAQASHHSQQGRTQTLYSKHQSKSSLAKHQSSESLALKDTLQHYRKQTIFLMLQKLHSLSNEAINEDLCEQLKLIQAKMIEQLDPACRPTPVDQLLELFGVASNLVVPHPGSDSRLQRQTSSQQRRQKNEKQMVPFVEKSVNQSQVTGFGKKKVLMDIERIKKIKQDREEQRKLDQLKQDQLQDRRKASVRRQIERRRIELGVGTDRENSQPKAILSNAQTESASPQENLQRINHKTVWFELDDEEDCEQQAVHLFMKRSQKLWRNLFSKYANIGYKIAPLNERGSFEGMNKQQEHITLAELTKMFKDHDAYPQVLSKDDLTNLVRIINQKHHQPSLNQLDYQRYTTFILQSALNGYSRSQQTMFLAPVEKLKLLCSQFERATKKRGASTLLFENDSEPIQNYSAQIIAQLTSKVNENPTYPLPEGLTKVKERCQVLSYRISETVLPMLSEAQQVALPLLDDLINKLFSFHVLEPFATFEDQYRIKPLIQKGMPPKPPALNFPKASAHYAEGSGRPKKLAPLSQVALVPVEPSVQMQDAVAATEHTYDDELQFEISKILDTIVHACVNMPELRNQDFKNGLARNAKQKELQAQQVEAEREAKRKGRDAKIKQDLERLKIERAEREERQAAERAEEQRLAKLAEKKRQEATRKSINRIIEEARQREPKPKEEPIESVKPKRSQSKPPTKEQIAKQRQSHKDLMTKLSQQNQLMRQTEEEARQKELLLREATKKKNEQQMAIQRQQRQRDAHFSQQLANFVESDEFKTVVGKYDHMLSHVFKFYCTQGKVDLTVDPKFKQSHMSLAEFSKFGYQTKVVPVLVTADEIITIFRTVEKTQANSTQAIYEKRSSSQENGGKAAHMLGYEAFMQALVRIVAYSYPKLETTDASSSSGQERRQSKEKVKELIQKKESAKQALQTQVLLEMRAEYTEKLQKTKQALAKSSPNAENHKGLTQNSSTDKLLGDPDFQRWLKQQESLGNGLQKRIEARQSQVGTGTSANVKQSRVQKQIELAEKMSKADIRDGRAILKEWDFNNVSIQAFEKLLKFIGIEQGSDLSVSHMNDVINAQRVENQGHKISQNKLKKLLLPQRKSKNPIRSACVVNEMQTIQENAAGEDLGKTYDKNVLQGNVEESGDFYLHSEQLRGSIEGEGSRTPINQRLSEQGTDERAENPKTIELDPATVQTEKTELLKAQHKIPSADEEQDEVQALPVDMASKPVEPESIAEVEASKEEDMTRILEESQRQDDEEGVTVGEVNQDAGAVRSDTPPAQKQQVNDDMEAHPKPAE